MTPKGEDVQFVVKSNLTMPTYGREHIQRVLGINFIPQVRDHFEQR